MENTSWEFVTFYVEPTDINTQLIHRLSGWMHMEASLQRMLSLLCRTQVYYNNSTIIIYMSSPHCSYYDPDRFSTALAISSTPTRSSEPEIPPEPVIPWSDLPDSGIHPARFLPTPLAFPQRLLSGYTKWRRSSASPDYTDLRSNFSQTLFGMDFHFLHPEHFLHIKISTQHKLCLYNLPIMNNTFYRL